MKKSWYHRLFSRSQSEITPAQIDRENADVQFGIAFKFAAGEDDLRDYVQAAEWYRKAADQNHSLAQFNLGVMYHEGQGVARDEAASIDWFGKAARLGDAGAQFNLGKIHYRASLTGNEAEALESRIEAYKWFQLAVKQGYKGAHMNFSSLVQKMTHEAVATADERVAAFVIVTPAPAS